MPLTKPNQQLRRDLKEAAAVLKWAGVNLFGVAKRMLTAGDEQGANDLMKIALSFRKKQEQAAAESDHGQGRLHSTPDHHLPLNHSASNARL